MEMEIEENYQFNEIDSSKINVKYINGTLGREIQSDEKSFLELSDRLSLHAVNGDQEELNNNNCYERYICSKCNIPKPSARLLDIHIQEDHNDILFKLLSERQPMYECYIESCDLKFNNPAERDEHCNSIHKYVKSFGNFINRGQLAKWESINKMNQQNTSQKRKNVDDFQCNKKLACDSNLSNEFQPEKSKSTLTFVPRQILLDKLPGIHEIN